jgi:hypothetical protein
MVNQEEGKRAKSLQEKRIRGACREQTYPLLSLFQSSHGPIVRFNYCVRVLEML